MRISSSQFAHTMHRNITLFSPKLNKLNEQMAAKKRILVPSDDPIGSTRLVQLEREQASINQYKENITRLSGSLSQQETHIDSMTKQLLSIRDKILSASNETSSTKDTNGYGLELDAMLKSIVSTLNSKNAEGQYFFSGTKTTTEPVVFDQASDKYVYQGNNKTREVTVANGELMQENSNAGDMFFNGSGDLLNDLNKLASMMKDPNTDFNSSEYKDALKNILGTIDDSINSLTSTMTDMGGRQNRLELLKDAHVDIQTANELVMKDIGELDIADAYIEMQSYLLAIQASQKTYAQISQLSLFNAI